MSLETLGISSECEVGLTAKEMPSPEELRNILKNAPFIYNVGYFLLETTLYSDTSSHD
jgi:hypothetical protein